MSDFDVIIEEQGGRHLARVLIIVGGRSDVVALF